MAVWWFVVLLLKQYTVIRLIQNLGYDIHYCFAGLSKHFYKIIKNDFTPLNLSILSLLLVNLLDNFPKNKWRATEHLIKVVKSIKLHININHFWRISSWYYYDDIMTQYHIINSLVSLQNSSIQLTAVLFYRHIYF